MELMKAHGPSRAVIGGGWRFRLGSKFIQCVSHLLQLHEPCDLPYIYIYIDMYVCDVWISGTWKSPLRWNGLMSLYFMRSCHVCLRFFGAQCWLLFFFLLICCHCSKADPNFGPSPRTVALSISQMYIDFCACVWRPALGISCCQSARPK